MHTIGTVARTLRDLPNVGDVGLLVGRGRRRAGGASSHGHLNPRGATRPVENVHQHDGDRADAQGAQRFQKFQPPAQARSENGTLRAVRQAAEAGSQARSSSEVCLIEAAVVVCRSKSA